MNDKNITCVETKTGQIYYYKKGKRVKKNLVPVDIIKKCESGEKIKKKKKESKFFVKPSEPKKPVEVEPELKLLALFSAYYYKKENIYIPVTYLGLLDKFDTYNITHDKIFHDDIIKKLPPDMSLVLSPIQTSKYILDFIDDIDNYFKKEGNFYKINITKLKSKKDLYLNFFLIPITKTKKEIPSIKEILKQDNIKNKKEIDIVLSSILYKSEYPKYEEKPMAMRQPSTTPIRIKIPTSPLKIAKSPLKIKYEKVLFYKDLSNKQILDLRQKINSGISLSIEEKKQLYDAMFLRSTKLTDREFIDISVRLDKNQDISDMEATRFLYTLERLEPTGEISEADFTYINSFFNFTDERIKELFDKEDKLSKEDKEELNGLMMKRKFLMSTYHMQQIKSYIENQPSEVTEMEKNKYNLSLKNITRNDYLLNLVNKRLEKVPKVETIKILSEEELTIIYFKVKFGESISEEEKSNAIYSMKITLLEIPDDEFMDYSFYHEYTDEDIFKKYEEYKYSSDVIKEVTISPLLKIFKIKSYKLPIQNYNSIEESISSGYPVPELDMQKYNITKLNMQYEEFTKLLQGYPTSEPSKTFIQRLFG